MLIIVSDPDPCTIILFPPSVTPGSFGLSNAFLALNWLIIFKALAFCTSEKSFGIKNPCPDEVFTPLDPENIGQSR